MGAIVSSSTDSQEAVNAANGVLADKVVVDETKSVPEPKQATGETAEASDATETDLEETPSLDSTSTEEGEDEVEAKDDEEKAPKKKGGFQKRIEKFQKKLSEKDQEIEYLRKIAFEKKQQEDPPKSPVEKVEVIGKPQAPKANDFETHEEYVKAHDNYVETLTDWKLEQKDKQREQAARENAAKTEFQKKGDAFQSRINEFKKSAEDFDDLMEDVNIDVPLHLQEVFLTSELGPALMYELAKNQKELERISKLPPITAALELGKIEARLAKASELPASKELKTPKAPTPIAPIGAKGGSLKKSIDDPNLSQREYERLREEQIKARMA